LSENGYWPVAGRPASASGRVFIRDKAQKALGETAGAFTDTVERQQRNFRWSGRPALAAWIPAFEAATLERAWAGYYEPPGKASMSPFVV